MAFPLIRYGQSWLGQSVREQRIGGAWQPIDFKFVERKHKGKVYLIRVAHGEKEPTADYFEKLNKGYTPFEMERVYE